jgi:hypothetical protein
MPRKVEPYGASDIQNQLIFFLTFLNEEGLLENFSPEQVYRWVTPSGRRGPDMQFHVIIDENDPLAFTPKRLGAKTVRVEVSSQCKRRGRNRLDLDEHTVLVRVWDRPPDGGAKVIHRAHIDLANIGQSGPWSHLQFGGRSIKKHEGWPLPKEVSDLRWPSQLFDIVLVCELIVYNFWPDKWARLCGKPEFVSKIHSSEQSYVRPFFEAWARYDSLSGSERKTFLGALCNKLNKHPWRPA